MYSTLECYSVNPTSKLPDGGERVEYIALQRVEESGMASFFAEVLDEYLVNLTASRVFTILGLPKEAEEARMQAESILTMNAK